MPEKNSDDEKNSRASNQNSIYSFTDGQLRNLARSYLTPTNILLVSSLLLVVVTAISFVVYAHAETHGNLLTDGMKASLCVAGVLSAMVNIALFVQWQTSRKVKNDKEMDFRFEQN